LFFNHATVPRWHFACLGRTLDNPPSDAPVVIIAFSALLGASVGVGLAFEKTAAPTAALVAGIPLLFVLRAHAWSRLCWVVLGGMVVFQAPAGANLFRLAYLAGIMVCLLNSLRQSRRYLNTPLSLLVRVPIVVLAAVAPGIVTGLILNPAQDVFRDAFSFLLLGIAPLVGLDAGQNLNPRAIQRFVVCVGVIASAGFAIDWLNRRGVSSLSFGRLIFASLVFGVPGFVLALALSGDGRNRKLLKWAFAATTILAGYLVTGVRTTLTLVACLPAVARRSVGVRGRIMRIVILLVPLIFAGSFIVPFLSKALVNDPNFLIDRIKAAGNVVAGAPSHDQSFVIRRSIYELTLHRWTERPLFGWGAGHDYSNDLRAINPNASFEGKAFVLDSPFMSLAKLGVVGTLGLFALVGSLPLTAWRLVKRVGRSPATITTIGFSFVIFVMQVFLSLFDEKGLSLAIVLLTALIASTLRPVQPTLGLPAIESDVPRPSAAS
jgi:hypothetical protein